MKERTDRTDPKFILDFQQGDYPYLEEINEGILKQIPRPLVGNGAAILDVGAGSGALGEVLRQRGYHVCGIESNLMAAREASLRLDQVICADLHHMDDIHSQLETHSFNYIIFSDILEHVYDPLQVLRSYLPLLADDGRILVSLPNAVNWLNRLYVLLGKFHYQMTGVMDRTHIRFFTLKTARQLLEASHCVVETVDSTPFIIRAGLPMIKNLLYNSDNVNQRKQIIDSPLYTFYKKYLYPIEYRIASLLPSLLAFRIILVAHKKLK